MRDWKARDTVMVIFMVAVVGIMLMQMVQNDRLYERMNHLIRAMEANTAGGPMPGMASTSPPAGALAGTQSRPAGTPAAWRVPNCQPGGAAILGEESAPTNMNIFTYK